MDTLLNNIREKSVKICSDNTEYINKLIACEMRLRNDFITTLKQTCEEYKAKVINVNNDNITKMKQKRNEHKIEYNAKLLQAFEEQKSNEKSLKESMITLDESMCCSAISEFEKHFKTVALVHCSGQTSSKSFAKFTFPDSEKYKIKEDIRQWIRKELMDSVCEVLERTKRKDKATFGFICKNDSVERDELSNDFNRKLFEYLESFEYSQRSRRSDRNGEQDRKLRDECAKAVKLCFERLKKRRGELQLKLEKSDSGSTMKVNSVKQKYAHLKNVMQRNLMESAIKERQDYDEEVKTGNETYFSKMNVLFKAVTDETTNKANDSSDRRDTADKYLRDIFDAFTRKQREYRDNSECKLNETNAKYRTAFVIEAKKQVKHFMNSFKSEKIKNENKTNEQSMSSSKKRTDKKRRNEHKKRKHGKH